MALKTQFIHGAHFHCLPRRAAGSDARGRKWSCEKGGKRPQTHFRLYEVTVSGKETCGGATGTMSVCLFSLSVSQKRGKRRSEVGGGGTTGMSFRRMCAKAFIATVNIYSSGGIPWTWFSRGCCCCCLERWGIDQRRQAGDSLLGANCVTWTSITPR